eukprot:COSAG02_NODE_332_length_24474_cov_23.190949_21_plen_228_part_00
MLVGRTKVHEPGQGSECPCRSCKLRLMAQGPQHNSLLQEGEELLAEIAQMEKHALKRNAELRRRRRQWLKEAVTNEVRDFLSIQDFAAERIQTYWRKAHHKQCNDEQNRNWVVRWWRWQTVVNQLVKLLLNHPYEHESLYKVVRNCKVYEDEDMKKDEDEDMKKKKGDDVELVPGEVLNSRRKRDWPEKIIGFASGWVYMYNEEGEKNLDPLEEIDPVTDPDVSTLA